MTGSANQLTRRALLSGAGAAVAVGVGAAVAPAAAAAANGVAVGPDDITVAEFRGRMAQTGDSGQDLKLLGFLTKLRGATFADLFAGSPHAVGTALFTVFGTLSVRNRVLDMSVHALDVGGTFTVYQRSAAGAHFDAPASFQKGRAVGVFSSSLQLVLTYIASATFTPTLIGDLTQTSSATLRAGLTGQSFGAVHQRLRLFGTGLGTLTDPVTQNANHEIAGQWSAG